MIKIPQVSGREIVKALKKIGYEIDHQTGSHIILRHFLPPYKRVSVPDHKEIAKGTLKSILRQTGLTNENFLKLL